MPVAHDTAATVRVLHLGVRGKECFDLGLDHLLQHLSRTRPQSL